MAWSDLEAPILKAIDQFEDTGSGPDVEEVAEHLDIEPPRVAMGVRRLVDADYVTAINTSTFEGDHFSNIRLAERGLREVSNWPSEAELIGALVAALSETAEVIDDDDQRSRLQRAGAALGGLSRDVMVQVAAELATRGVMLGL